MGVHRTERLCHCPKKKGVRQTSLRLPHPNHVYYLIRVRFSEFHHACNTSPYGIFALKTFCPAAASSASQGRPHVAVWLSGGSFRAPHALCAPPRRLMTGPGNIAVKRRDARARSCRFVRCCLTGSRSRCPANCLHTCLSTAPAIPSVFVSPALCWAISADCRSRCRAQRSCWLCR